MARGKTPIEKNIIVVDEQGNEYEATYSRRARGLVKKGRARFMEENKICLACPPNMILEEQQMNNAIDNKPELTAADILEKIDRIASDIDYIRDAIRAIGAAEEIEETASALVSIVQLREKTNQQIIALYAQMYRDLCGEAEG